MASEQHIDSIRTLELTRLDGTTEHFSEYIGQVLLIVNVASECGFTPQYAGLQKLYADYRDRGFQILAFPCNQFGGQEPGNAEQIATFCTQRFQVEFPLFAKVEVNGKAAHPLFQWLKQEAPGALGTEAIKWNFTKFLLNRQGRVLDRYAPTTRPEQMATAIEAALAEAE